MMAHLASLQWIGPVGGPNPFKEKAFQLAQLKTLPPVTLQHEWVKHVVRDTSGLLVESEIPVLNVAAGLAPVHLEIEPVVIGPEMGDWRWVDGMWRKWQPSKTIENIKTMIIEMTVPSYHSYFADLAASMLSFAKQISGSPVADLEELVPALNADVSTCPARRRCSKRGQQLPLRDRIVHLNDHHKWSRERIADWLETLDVDLTLQPAASGD